MVSGELCNPNFFGKGLLGFVVMRRMPGIFFVWFVFSLIFSFVGLWLFFPLVLVQHGAWLSSWASLTIVILIVSSVLLSDLLSHRGSFLGFGLSCLWVWLCLHKLL